MKGEEGVRFYLGTHLPNWLGKVTIPLFVSRRTLAPRRTLPRALGPWALDSGGFTELSMHGRWTVPATQYVAEVRRFRDEIGGMEWAAPRDWMCEPAMLRRTGLSVIEHQRRTVSDLLELRALAPDLPFIPVLQGWHEWQYLEHLEAYTRAGVDLTKEPLVGLGSVCRRQGMAEATRIVRRLALSGLRIHGFGFKLTGLERCSRWMAGSDSLAWSYNARRNPPLPGCPHRNCTNCLRRALWWRHKALAAIKAGQARRW
jgi:hypothetical protein